MARGTQVEVMTPGRNQKAYLAGAWDTRTGHVLYTTGARQDAALCCAWLDRLAMAYPAQRYDRVWLVVDNYRVHQVRAVQQWLAAHPRMALLFLPHYCPQANPIERIFGDAHDHVTRHHRRQRRPECSVHHVVWSRWRKR